MFGFWDTRNSDADLWSRGDVHRCWRHGLVRLFDHSGRSLVGLWLGHGALYPVGEVSEKTKLKLRESPQDERALEKDLSARPFWQNHRGEKQSAERSAVLSFHIIKDMTISWHRHATCQSQWLRCGCVNSQSVVFQTSQWHLARQTQPGHGPHSFTFQVFLTFKSVILHTLIQFLCKMMCLKSRILLKWGIWASNLSFYGRLLESILKMLRILKTANDTLFGHNNFHPQLKVFYSYNIVYFTRVVVSQ